MYRRELCDQTIDGVFRVQKTRFEIERFSRQRPYVRIGSYRHSQSTGDPHGANFRKCLEGNEKFGHGVRAKVVGKLPRGSCRPELACRQKDRLDVARKRNQPVTRALSR